MLKIEKSVCKQILNSFYDTELQFSNGTGREHDDDEDNEIDCQLSLINFNETVGFLGKHLRLFIRHKCDTISAFVKLSPDNAENNFGYSKIEILFYQEIYPKLKLRHKLCPKPFYINLKEDIIILEDISKLEFKMVNKLLRVKLEEIFEIEYKNLHNNRSYCRVLNHGDLWSNNILIKKTTNSENEYQVMLVDFQLICFASPAYDLLKFYLLSVNKQIKNEYGLKHFLNIYYDELEKHVLNLDLILTRNQLHKCASVFWRTILLDAAMSSTIIFLNELVYKNIFEGEHGLRRFMLTDYRTEIVTKAFLTDNSFRSVMTDLILQIANSNPV